MRDPERACVAAEPRKPREQVGVGRAREQRGEERVFLRAREIDLVDLAGRRLAIEIGPQPHARDAGRCLDGQHALGGNFSQFDTDGCEMPTRRASSETPPTAWIAALSPGSRIAKIAQRCRPTHMRTVQKAKSCNGVWSIGGQ